MKIGIDLKKNHTYVPTNRNDVTYKWIFKQNIPHMVIFTKVKAKYDETDLGNFMRCA
jgi:hypothetical protein